MSVTAADGSDGADDDATTFLQFEGMPTLSRAAFQLHSFAIINSISDGHPGFVGDDYLNAITAETTTTALELEAAGMWQRRDGGYPEARHGHKTSARGFDGYKVLGLHINMAVRWADSALRDWTDYLAARDEETHP